MENPLISILMPVYNTERYIGEAIESVIKQTYTNWELIICDDCSMDNSYEVALNYSKHDSRIKVIKNSENMRQAYSRNHAFKASRGEYIVILDSDDRMKPNKLERQLEFLQKNEKYAFVCTNAVMFNNSGDIIGYLSKNQTPSYLDVIRNKGFVYPTMMIKRRAFEDVEGYTVSNITQTGEDYDLICKLYYHEYKGTTISEYLYEYRVEDVYKRRPFTVYFNEYKVGISHVKARWFELYGISNVKKIYIFLPILKGLIPQKLIQKYHKIKFKKM